MNKKGFTVVEVVVSFGILSVVMLMIITFMITYRDKVKNAEIETQLIDFKNSMTKMIYDEIIAGRYLRIDYCTGESNCVYFTDTNGDKHYLRVVEVARSTPTEKKGEHLQYDGAYYMLPDSDLNEPTDDMCSFNDVTLETYEEKIYSLKVNYHHYGLGKSYTIAITIN